jgi:phage terminase large subunit-like protein
MEGSSEQLALMKIKEQSLCECGCHQLAPPGKRFILGHNRRGKRKAISKIKSIRSVTSKEKARIAHRLYFPERGPEESLGDYFFRKFEFFCSNYVTHIAGKYAGQPVRLMKWQRRIFRKLFSTIDENGRRRYRRLYIHIPRKNGKTFLVCLLVLYWLVELSFYDAAAEIVSCASTREQSIKTIFRTARLMVAASAELTQLLKVGIVPPHITNRLNHGVYEPLASDSAPQLGKNVSLVIFDETHSQPNGDLWGAMGTSQGMREEPLFVSISTAGNTRSSFYFTIYERMKEIESNPELDLTTLVLIYEAPELMDWRDPKAFRIANPSIGDDEETGFRSGDEIEEARKQAIEGEGESAFKQFYLNLWAQHGRRTFLPLDRWDACEVPTIDVDLLKESQCWAGIDLSLTTALTGLAILFSPNPHFPKWACFTFAWLAGENLQECSRRDHLPYEKWIADEVLFFDGQPTIDVDSILDILRKIAGVFPQLRIIGYDPYSSIQIEFWKKYFDLEPVPQQYSFLSPAIKSLQVKILDGNILHEPNPLMRSMIEAARIISDPNGNLRLDKAKSFSRIDCLSALANCEVMALKYYIKPKEVN